MENVSAPLATRLAFGGGLSPAPDLGVEVCWAAAQAKVTNATARGAGAGSHACKYRGPMGGGE
jgi:hypothetical protein